MSAVKQYATVEDDWGCAPMQAFWFRWHPLGAPGYWDVSVDTKRINDGRGFGRTGMNAVVNDFGDLVCVS